jgi:PAS domain S-box-containing protein
MAGRVRAFDWSKTPVGAIDTWSPSLRLAVDMILATNFPMALRWGPELVLIYNDAYAPALHEQHPRALGVRFSDTSPEFQASIRTLHENILSGVSGGFAFERLPLKVTRGGRRETGYFRVSYSPMPDATAANGVGGVLVAAVEISQSVAAEKTLRTTQERYAMAREVAGVVGAWEWDIKANKVYADPRYAELHNIAPEFAEAGLPAQSYTPAVHPDDRVRIRDIALKAASEGGGFSGEYRLIQADGSVRWVYTRGRAYLDGDGQPSATPASSSTSPSARPSRPTWRPPAWISTSPPRPPAWAAGTTSRQNQRLWDARARAIFGLSPTDEPSGETLDRLMHPADKAMVHAAVTAATDPTGPGTINLEYRIRRGSDGALRWVETFGRAFFEDGRCVRFVGVVSDVTERREAVDRLLRQEETLRLAIDAADVGTWDLDLDTGALIWSDRCYAMFGIKPGDPIDLDSVLTRIHPADQPRVRDAMQQALDPAVRAEYSTSSAPWAAMTIPSAGWA